MTDFVTAREPCPIVVGTSVVEDYLCECIVGAAEGEPILRCRDSKLANAGRQARVGDKLDIESVRNAVYAHRVDGESKVLEHLNQYSFDLCLSLSCQHLGTPLSFRQSCYQLSPLLHCEKARVAGNEPNGSVNFVVCDGAQ